MPSRDAAATFIARWDGTERAERANYISFLNELCALIGVAPPPPSSGGLGDYRFERAVTRHEPDGATSNRRIDLYKRGCFILEAKQGANEARQFSLLPNPEADRRAMIRRSAGWTQAMLKARGQAEAYARDLPPEEGWPPFLIIADVGFCLDLYADFSGTGKHYAQFPDRESFRIYLADLRDDKIRDRLKTIFTEPMSLDPSRKRVQVTKDIAALLARLARALEAANPPDAVASFLMRAIFCMFAQSVGLLPSKTAFTDLLQRCQNEPIKFIALVGEFWRTMNTGGFSVAAEAELRRFNGGLYAFGPHGPVEPLKLNADMIELLIAAARRDWADVEPAIFGTLLENALDTRLRGQLGAHFTPRAFVERLVLPTVMEPLRAEWDAVKAAAFDRAEAGDRPGAAKLVRDFHARLCAVRVLDPACGTGNFLYVTMELMKRLEGEVLDILADLASGEADRLAMSGTSVDPHQFFGLEKNPRAVPVAELVLWIGYLQWHFRTQGDTPLSEPILRDFHNIRHADALLDYAKEEIERDKNGQPISRWDGETFKVHPITGENIPDEDSRVVTLRPMAPKQTVWPDVDFVVGNPPFIAGKDMRSELGDGYAMALWDTYDKVPKSADIAMFFWWKATKALIGSKTRLERFGFITSSTIRQIFCRRVISDAMLAKRAVRLAFAIPDHPWADGAGTAAVRIAMTVAEATTRTKVRLGAFQTVVSEMPSESDAPTVTLAVQHGKINADLSIGADAASSVELRANERLCSPGMKLHGKGFIISQELASRFGLDRNKALQAHIRPYLNGRDLTQHSRHKLVIDMFGLSESELRQRFPAVFEHLLLHVKPERSQNNRATYRDNWWIFGEPRSEFRPAVTGLLRYIATVETAKHRPFCFVPSIVIPDNKLICFALADSYSLGVLSSTIHVLWSVASGGRIGVGNDPVYVKTRCFDPFPFPNASPTQRERIGQIAEELDTLRRTRLDAHPQLTLTGLYNVLEKLRAGTPLTDAERDIHDAGHVSILRTLHDTLDREVAAAYGWRPDLSAPEIVARIVALNAERRAEEERGLIRWLRPEFQAPTEARAATQTRMEITEETAEELPAWPPRPAEQYLALRSALTLQAGRPQDLARRFRRAPTRKIEEMLDTLAALGQAHKATDGSYYI